MPRQKLARRVLNISLDAISRHQRNVLFAEDSIRLRLRVVIRRSPLPTLSAVPSTRTQSSSARA
jgi:hypothetical protein